MSEPLDPELLNAGLLGDEETIGSSVDLERMFLETILIVESGKYSVQDLRHMYFTAAIDGTLPNDGSAEVSSVNGRTGDVVITADDIGAATKAQGAKADTAVQPNTLTEYAKKDQLFSKDYNELINKPQLFGGSYNQLTDKPVIPSTPEQVGAQPKGDYALKSELFSKNYNELTNRPTIPSTPEEVGAQPAGDYARRAELLDYAKLTDVFSGNYDDLHNQPDLFDGSYTSLTNRPTIPAQPQDIGAQPAGNYALKSELFSGNYNDLTNRPNIPNVLVLPGTELVPGDTPTGTIVFRY